MPRCRDFFSFFFSFITFCNNFFLTTPCRTRKSEWRMTRMGKKDGRGLPHGQRGDAIVEEMRWVGGQLVFSVLVGLQVGRAGPMKAAIAVKAATEGGGGARRHGDFIKDHLWRRRRRKWKEGIEKEEEVGKDGVKDWRRKKRKNKKINNKNKKVEKVKGNNFILFNYKLVPFFIYFFRQISFFVRFVLLIVFLAVVRFIICKKTTRRGSPLQ